jgi:hypothetical protein
MKKVDDYTVAFEFPEPIPSSFPSSRAARPSAPVRDARRIPELRRRLCPAHYLKQFLPKYSSEEAVTKKAKDLGFDSWVSCSRTGIAGR